MRGNSYGVSWTYTDLSLELHSFISTRRLSVKDAIMLRRVQDTLQRNAAELDRLRSDVEFYKKTAPILAQREMERAAEQNGSK